MRQPLRLLTLMVLPLVSIASVVALVRITEYYRQFPQWMGYRWMAFLFSAIAWAVLIASIALFLAYLLSE